MKKKILFVTALFAGSLAFAQGSTTSVKNSRGQEYLPQAGDWAIQFDAAPLLNYVGNAFSNAGTSAPGAASPFGAQNTFVGKYFISATQAYRVKLGITLSDYDSDTVGNVTNRNTTNVILGFGKEWRRGHNRLQGFYGAEALVQIGSPNVITSRTFADSLDAGTGFRSLGVTESSSFGVGVRGFIGVEYFIMPKISIGGEFGWGFGYQSSSFTVETEVFGATENVTSEIKRSGFAIDNDNGGSIFGGSAQLNVAFHF
ncbi:MAG: hypothetical protein ABF242_08295 [Flavobacteriales bacterium]